jgi:periplasmic copper chaperone A
MRPFFVAAFLILALGGADGALAGPDGVAVEQAWSRATPKGATVGVLYLTIINHGVDADRLLSASSPAAATLEFHSMKNENGVMQMAQLASLDVPPGGTVAFTPGALHIMMVGLKRQLKEGDAIPLTPIFEKAGAVEGTAQVGGLGAMADPHVGEH